MADLRIGYVLKRYPRLSETFVLNEILAHEAAGVEVHIFSLRLPEEAVVHPDVARVRAKVHYLPNAPVTVRDVGEALVRAADMLDAEECAEVVRDFKPARTLWQASQVASIAGADGITHLHAHFATEATVVARLASRLCGVPYTFTAHAKDIFHESVDTAKLRALAAEAAGVITVSEFNVAYLRERLGSDRAIHRIYNGLDLAEFPFCRGEREPGLIVGVGRLVEKKGFADLVRACGVLAREGRDFRCVIIGEGEEGPALGEEIERAQVGARVQLLGALPRDEVKAWMSRASVLAAPCVVGADGNRDGLPTVLLEAMALGTPCVGTPVTGIPEVLRDGQTGLLVPERDPASLAAAIGRLLDDRVLAQRCAGAARALIEESFDLHRNTAAQRDLFAVAAATGVA